MKIFKNAIAVTLCSAVLSGSAFSAFADNGEGDRISFKDKKEIALGDVDRDGKITTDDALLQLKKIVELEELHGVASCVADIDGDGKVTADDALAVLKNVVGLSDDLGKGTLLQADFKATERNKDFVIPYAEIENYKTLTVVVDLNQIDNLVGVCLDNGAIGFDNTENDGQWATPLEYQWSYANFYNEIYSNIEKKYKEKYGDEYEKHKKEFREEIEKEATAEYKEKYKNVSFRIDIDLSTVVKDKEIFVQYWWRDTESNGITYTFFAR